MGGEDKGKSSLQARDHEDGCERVAPATVKTVNGVQRWSVRMRTARTQALGVRPHANLLLRVVSAVEAWSSDKKNTMHRVQSHQKQMRMSTIESAPARPWRQRCSDKVKLACMKTEGHAPGCWERPSKLTSLRQAQVVVGELLRHLSDGQTNRKQAWAKRERHADALALDAAGRPISASPDEKRAAQQCPLTAVARLSGSYNRIASGNATYRPSRAATSLPGRGEKKT